LQRGVGLPESVATNERRTKREWAIEILARRFVNQAPGDSPRMTPDAPNKRAEPRIAPTQKPVPTPQRPNGLPFSRRPPGAPHRIAVKSRRSRAPQAVGCNAVLGRPRWYSRARRAKHHSRSRILDLDLSSYLSCSAISKTIEFISIQPFRASRRQNPFFALTPIDLIRKGNIVVINLNRDKL